MPENVNERPCFSGTVRATTGSLKLCRLFNSHSLGQYGSRRDAMYLTVCAASTLL